MSRSVNTSLKILVVVFVFIISLPLHAKELNVEEILMRMEKADENTKTVKFDFSQQIIFQLTGEKQIKSGKIIFEKPDKIRIDLQKPAEQQLVSDGKKIWIYTPGYRQVIVDQWKKWIKDDNLAYSFFVLSKNFRVFRKQYIFNLISNTDKLMVLELIPKNQELAFMRIAVDSETFIPKKTIIYLEGVQIETDTANTEINPKINKKLFKFKTPAKTELIEL